VEGIFKNLTSLSQLNNLAQIHYHHPLGNLPYHRQVMGDE
jgi:hypothetical protein